MPAHLKYVLRSRKKNDGTQQVQLRLTVGSNQVWINSGVYVLEKYWNKAASSGLENWINRKADDWPILTTRLRNKMRQAEQAVMQLEKEGKEITIALVADYVTRTLEGTLNKDGRSFLVFFSNQLAQIKTAQTEATAVKYQTIYNEISSFLGGQDLSFSDLTLEFIHKLEAHWLAKNRRNTVNKKLEQVKAMVSRAIDYNLLEAGKNPFLRYSFKWDKVHKERLTPDEMERIEAIELDSTSRLFDARSAFLFQYYCAGMRIGDALTLRWVNVQGDRLMYVMGKTGTTKSIKLPEQAQDILAHYRSKNPKETDFIFPFVRPGLDQDFIRKNRKGATGGPIANVNKLIKRLAEMAGLTKNLVTHMARHSFADHAQKATGDVYAVSRALGHSTIGITEAYLARLDEGAVDATLDAVFSKNKKPDQKPSSLQTQ